MYDFLLQLPTKVYFGRDIEGQIGPELKSRGATRVLIHYGGGSIKRIGLYDKVVQSLTDAGLAFVALGGAQPNPRIELVREGAALCKQENIDFILAVGGGSAIDSAKHIAISHATGRDSWEFIEQGETPEKATPLATVLTLSATGSEMSDSAVITNGNLKRGINCVLNRPAVSFLNPENTFSVSKFQTGCGIVDTMMHTLERYCTPDLNNDLTDRIAESVLIATKNAGRIAIAHPKDYEARATLMWASTLSHNGLTGYGKKSAFTVHKMEHDVSGLHPNVAHGAGLSVLFPAWAREVLQRDVRRFARLAVAVWGCEMDFDRPRRTALEGIRVMKQYFREIGMPVTMGELGIKPSDYAAIADLTTANNTKMPPSRYGDMTRERILRIYEYAE